MEPNISSEKQKHSQHEYLSVYQYDANNLKDYIHHLSYSITHLKIKMPNPCLMVQEKPLEHENEF